MFWSRRSVLRWEYHPSLLQANTNCQQLWVAGFFVRREGSAPSEWKIYFHSCSKHRQQRLFNIWVLLSWDKLNVIHLKGGPPLVAPQGRLYCLEIALISLSETQLFTPRNKGGKKVLWSKATIVSWKKFLMEGSGDSEGSLYNGRAILKFFI